MSNVKDKFYYNGADIYGSYGNYADIGSEWLHEIYYHQCEFPDTGLAKSWCKVCHVEGLYNFQLGKYLKQEEKT